ncbi:DUF4297 domain-containing protein [Paenibacillus sp. CFBP13512]|uniref:dsDNA nuclease domain-containing protein n=1 Tax=Paenibacillus sp. CFBP13512 TaxID=2184007 RepID=UPI0010C0654B|nr:dsDNA nuclease domain-containing protein [Paenibacillus sp. CFBP13512]TKJ93646.1 DUF4297 domain-containing protein [Paenibacillus sp. CFBP13512]
MKESIKKIDNGGAEAIKGFNFQKANLILLAIENYQKQEFKIYIEAEDDIVVSYKNYKAYIQVKKQKHTFNSITKKVSKKIKDADDNKITTLSASILEKNLSSGSDSDTYKIFVKDIGSSDKKKLNLKKPGSICTEVYMLSKDAKEQIINVLPNNFKNKLDNFYFYISPINDDLTEAVKYLVGCLNGINVSVDENRGRIVIAELALTIDQKAQEILSSTVDKELKAMNTDYFSKVFVTYETLNQFDRVLNSLGYNELITRKIKSERLKIELNSTDLKKDIKEELQKLYEDEELQNLSNREIIDIIIGNFQSSSFGRNTLISVAVECLCEVEV